MVETLFRIITNSIGAVAHPCNSGIASLVRKPTRLFIDPMHLFA